MKAHKNSWYKDWHTFRFNHHFHVAMLVFYVLSIFLGSIGFFLPNNGALAASKDWTFSENPPTDHYSYGTDVTVGGGVASLGNHTPSTDWVADSGGAHFYYRKTLTITNSGAAKTNYQVPVTISLGADSAKLKDDCTDLRFTKSSDGATALDYWIESSSSTSCKAWVEVDTIAATPTATTIYMYYGNSSAADASNAVNTFVANGVIDNIAGAWDLDEDVTQTTTVVDSADGNNGTANTLANVANRYGDTNKAKYFNGNGSDVVIPHNAGKLEYGKNALTIATWVYVTGPNALANNQYIINQYRGNNEVGFHITYKNTDGAFSQMEHCSQNADSYNQLSNVSHVLTGGWHLVTIVKDASGNLTQYYDGNTVSSGPTAHLTTTAPIGEVYNITYTGNLVFGSAYSDVHDSVYLKGNLDDVRIFNGTALSSAQVAALWGGASAATSNKSFVGMVSGVKKLLVHQYSTDINNPTGVIAVTDIDTSSEYDGYYHNNYPTIQNVAAGNGQSYSYISAMIITTGGTGSTRFQISPDNGTTWYRWNGSAWASIVSPDTYDPNKTNTSAEVTTNISSFRPGGANPRNFRWRTFLVSDGTQTATVDDVSITYVTDTAAPDNPVIGGVTAYQSDGGPTFTYDPAQLWHNYPAPKFVWTPPSDNAGVGEELSGIWRYYAKLTTDIAYTPTSADATTNNYLVASGLTNGQTYYSRVNTIDNAENESAASTLLTYKYDSVAPTDPTNLQVNTLQPTDQPLSFNWAVSTDVGTPGAMSEFDHYEYKVGSISAWTSTIATSVSGITGDEDGNNTFRVRAVDKAGNISGEDIIVYQYILNAPSEPLNVTVDDQQKDVNNFTFTWEVPSYVKPGNSITGYKIFVNELPSATPQNDYSYIDATNKNNLGNVLTKVGIRATHQSPPSNRFYVVAYDSESKINYSKYGWADFNVDTTSTAPTKPRNIAISDVSDRNTPEHFAIALSWKNPANYSAGTFGHYNIRRATSLTGLDTDAAWLALPVVGTATSNAFAESLVVGNIMYYYRVSGVDNAGAEITLSDVVQKIPTGKYIVVPAVNSGPSVTVTATTAVVNWVTDRQCYSKVEYGKAPDSAMQNSSLQGVTAHSITLYGLEPGTTYHYRVQSLDSGDQKDYDNNLAYIPLNGYSTFITQPAPGISDVKISDIRLDSALVTWKTTSSTTSTLKYGKTNSYGKELSDSSSSAVTTHTVKIASLDHSSTYHFKIFGTDTDGNVMQSDDYNFDTLTFPKVTNVNFQQIKGTATSTLKATWDSNVPISSTIRYTDPTGKTLEASQSQLVSKHEMIIAGLKDNTEYSMAVSGRDAYGNEGTSGSEKIKTDFDTRPPSISDITTETSMSGYGTDAKSQMIVSWDTDEPATSQVEYSKGVSGDSFTMATKEDNMLTTSHVVVVSDLDPSSSYYFRVVSHDNSKNEAKSGPNSALTEQARSSIFDIVLKSLESTIGWLLGGW